MSYLRGNFRKRAIDEDYTAIGGGLANWIQGSNINPDFRFGGLLVGSQATVSASGFVLISALDAISSTYGATLASNFATGGFKFIPLIFQDFATLAGAFFHLSATGVLAGDDSIAIVGLQSVAGAFSGSIHFIYAGLIVSAPQWSK